MAAALGESPRDRRRSVFSRITIESSTRMPIVRISASVLMKFRLKPSTRMIENVASKRGRNRHQHDGRHARAVQEQQQHDRRQHDGRHQLFEHAVDGSTDERAVVLDHDQLRAGRQLGLELWDQTVDAIGHVGRVGAGLCAEPEQHAVVPVDTRDLGLLLARQLHGGDVADVHRARPRCRR